MNPVVVVRRSAVCWPTALAQDSWPILRTRSDSSKPPILFLPPVETTRRRRPSSFRTSAFPPRFPSFHFCVTKKTIRLTNLNILFFILYYYKTLGLGSLQVKGIGKKFGLFFLPFLLDVVNLLKMCCLFLRQVDKALRRKPHFLAINDFVFNSFSTS